MAQDGTGYIGEAVQLGQAALLCQGKLADVVRSPAQIVQFLLGHLGVGCVNLLPGDPQRGAAVAVKAAVVLHQGAVAPGADGLNDLSHAAAPLRHLIRRADGFFRYSIGDDLLLLGGPIIRCGAQAKSTPIIF